MGRGKHSPPVTWLLFGRGEGGRVEVTLGKKILSPRNPKSREESLINRKRSGRYHAELEGELLSCPDAEQTHATEKV